MRLKGTQVLSKNVMDLHVFCFQHEEGIFRFGEDKTVLVFTLFLNYVIENITRSRAQTKRKKNKNRSCKSKPVGKLLRKLNLKKKMLKQKNIKIFLLILLEMYYNLKKKT